MKDGENKLKSEKKRTYLEDIMFTGVWAVGG